MLEKFQPTGFMSSVYTLTPELLKEKGIHTVITDLDNTLLPWNVMDATEELKQWAEDLQAAGITIIILSNNHGERVKRVAEQAGLVYQGDARKPLKKGMKRLIERFNVDVDSAVFVGDQLLTDVLLANRFGMESIFVRPVAETDNIYTKINRWFERKLVRHFKKKDPKWGWQDTNE